MVGCVWGYRLYGGGGVVLFLLVVRYPPSSCWWSRDHPSSRCVAVGDELWGQRTHQQANRGFRKGGISQCSGSVLKGGGRVLKGGGLVLKGGGLVLKGGGPFLAIHIKVVQFF